MVFKSLKTGSTKWTYHKQPYVLKNKRILYNRLRSSLAPTNTDFYKKTLKMFVFIIFAYI